MAGNAIGSERFFHNDAGKIIRSLAFDAAGHDFEHTDFVYEDQGSAIAITRKTSGEFVRRNVKLYRENLLLTSATYDEWDRLKREKILQYAGNRLTKSDSKYYFPDGTLYEQGISSYDVEGRVEMTYALNASGAPLGDGKYLHEYDSEGRLRHVWSLNEFTSDDIPNAVTTYQYDTDNEGNWTQCHTLTRRMGDSRPQRLPTTTRKLTYYPTS
jgi:hypothetical protein